MVHVNTVEIDPTEFHSDGGVSNNAFKIWSVGVETYA
jgi:hypothetical protein